MFDISEVKRLAALARIELSEKEAEALRADIGAILGYVETVREANGAGEEDAAAALRNVMRKDEEPHEGGAFTEALLAAAPECEGQYIAVKKIL